MRSQGVLLGVLAAALFARSPVEAQAGRSMPTRRWAISIAGGAVLDDRATGSIENAMRAAGLAGVMPAGCFIYCSGPISFPQTYRDGPQTTLVVRYFVRPAVQVRFLWAQAPLGETHGYQADLHFLTLDKRVSTYALMGAVGTGPLWLAVGPSLNRFVVRESFDPQQPQRSATRAGLALSAELTVPERRRLFVVLSADYRFVLPTDVGPYEVDDFAGAVIATLPRTSVSPSHGVVSLGLGFRM